MPKIIYIEFLAEIFGRLDSVKQFVTMESPRSKTTRP